MRYSTTTGLVLAAFSIGEVVAGPAHAHAHLHKKMHEKKDVDWSALDWNNMGIDWSAAYEAGLASKTAAAVVAASTAAASVAAYTTAASASAATASVAASSSESSSSESLVDTLVSDVKMLFGSVVGVSNSRTSFGTASAASGSTGDFYMGNVGIPYGSNIIKASSAADHDYSITFKNTASSGMTINIWNKAGHDGKPLSGSAFAPKTTTLTLYLPAGSSQVVGIQENSQIGWAEACSETTASGAFATTWGEANFVSSGSGYDVSAILNPNNNNYDMTITSEEAPDCTSSRTENFWLTETQPIGTSDGSCYISQSTAHLTVKMGGTV